MSRREQEQYPVNESDFQHAYRAASIVDNPHLREKKGNKRGKKNKKTDGGFSFVALQTECIEEESLENTEKNHTEKNHTEGNRTEENHTDGNHTKLKDIKENTQI